MAIVAKFKLEEKVERTSWAFDEEHFGADAPCRAPDGGYNQGLCEHGHWGSSSMFRFSALLDGQENAEWAAATPSGELTMTIANPAAVRQLEVGAVYTVTIQKSRS